MRVFDSRKLLSFGVLLLFATLAVYGAAPAGTAAVKNLSFDSNGPSLEVNISASEGAHYTYFELSNPARLVVDFHDLKNKVGFKQKHVDAAGVERIRTSTFVDKKRNVTRIVFDLSSETPYHFTDEAGGVVKITFGEETKTASDSAPLNSTESLPTEGLPVVAELKPVSAPELEPVSVQGFPQLVNSALLQTPVSMVQAPAQPALPEQSPVPQATPSVTPTQTPAASPYSGEIFSFDLHDNVSLKDFFRLISQISGLNIYLDPTVTGPLPALMLTDVPWDQALDLVLRNSQLGTELQGNVLRVAPLATLQKEQDDKKKLKDAAELSVDLMTQTYVLSYTKAAEVQPTITKMLSSRGLSIPDTRRNALIVKDIPSRFPQLNQTIKFLDTPAQQVEIEARIISANKSFSRDIGNQLGFLFGNGRNNQVGGATEAGTSPLTRVGGTALPLAVNLPAAATSGLSLLSGLGGDVLLDEILTAAEASGTAKVISRPKVTTQNNMPATVQNGTQIPVQTNVNNTVSVQFLTFALTLTVTPQITEAGTILLNVDIENSQPDFAKAVNGIPSVATQSAKATYLIQDGGTQSIAGILVDNDSLNIRQVPGLGSLPLIGNLFKETSVIKSTSELLFFITARILPSDGSGIRLTPTEAAPPKPQLPPR